MSTYLQEEYIIVHHCLSWLDILFICDIIVTYCDIHWYRYTIWPRYPMPVLDAFFWPVHLHWPGLRQPADAAGLASGIPCVNVRRGAQNWHLGKPLLKWWHGNFWRFWRFNGRILTQPGYSMPVFVAFHGLAGPQSKTQKPCEHPQQEGDRGQWARSTRKLESFWTHLKPFLFET